ncbi:MAG TPA: hypothetical protein VLA66_05770 [Thermoanaerobaculia bacterium]|nr:hypothetical protein [Thermoanaerobaculia bacterium]
MLEICSARTGIAKVLSILVLATALSCGGGGGGGGSTPTTPPPPAPPPPSPGVVEVQVADNVFTPMSITVEPGTTVRWVFTGSAPGHTVTDLGGTFDSGFAFTAAGDAFEHTFGSEVEGQTFNYRCVSHQACCLMQGSVRVGETAPEPEPGY